MTTIDLDISDCETLLASDMLTDEERQREQAALELLMSLKENEEIHLEDAL
jgi:hypothetical protein